MATYLADEALPLTPEAAEALRALRFVCADSAVWNAAAAALGGCVPPVSEAEPRIGAALAAEGALLVLPQQPSPKDLAGWRDTLELLVSSPRAIGVLLGMPAEGALGPAILAAPDRGVAAFHRARLVLTPDGASLAVADVPPPICAGQPPVALAALGACGSLDELLRRAARQVVPDDADGWRVAVVPDADRPRASQEAPHRH